MSKVTSKLQVTIPKAIADRYRIAPGDEIAWAEAGDVIRVIPPGRTAAQVLSSMPSPSIDERLRLFDAATRRQRLRERGGPPTAKGGARGWTREELYGRGRAR